MADESQNAAAQAPQATTPAPASAASAPKAKPKAPAKSKPQVKPKAPAAKSDSSSAPVASHPTTPAPRRNRSQHIRSAPPPPPGPEKSLEEMHKEYFEFDDDSLESHVSEGEERAETPEDPTDLSDKGLKTRAEGGETRQPAAAETKPTEEPASKGMSKLLLSRARAVGLTEDQVIGEDPALVERYVTQLEERAQRPARQQAEAQQTEGPKEPDIDWGVDETGKPLTAEDLHPSVVKVTRDLHKQIADLKAELASVGQYLQQEATQKRISWIDSQFQALAETHGDFLGRGTVQELGPNAPETLRRRAVINTVAEMARLEEAAGRPVDHARLFRQVAEQLFGPGKVNPPKTQQQQEQPSAPTRPRDPETGRFLSEEEIEEQERAKAEWQAGGLASPTARRDRPTRDPRKRAISAIAEHMSQNGQYVADSGEESELPE